MTTTGPCTKRCYSTRKYAKQKLREFRGRGLIGARGPVHVYRCERCNGMWHIGHHGKADNEQLRMRMRSK